MFHGSLVALVTPFTASGQIDFNALGRLIQFHLDNHTDALVICGSTGEAATLSLQEQTQLISYTVREIKGRLPIIVGTGTNCTEKTIMLTQTAMELGADACLVVTPYYNKPTQEGLFLHYDTLAKAVPVPLIIYNIPGRSAVDMLPETVLRLVHLPNIIGIKESSTQLVERAAFYTQHAGGELDFYSGDDLPTLDAIKAGAKGVISVAANVVPQTMHNLCHFAREKQFESANALQQQLLSLFEALFAETNPIPVKWALSRMGLIEAHLRLPLTTLSSEHHARLQDALVQAGISLT